MVSRRLVLEIDDEAQEAVGIVGRKLGTTDLTEVLRHCLGGYAALLHHLDANPGSKLGLILKNDEYIEIELRVDLQDAAPVIPLFPVEESDHEIEKFLNDIDEPFVEESMREVAENCDGELQEVTQQKVDEALNNALESGYDYRHYDNYEELAIDIGTYDAELEGAEPEQLVPLIKDWQARSR